MTPMNKRPLALATVLAGMLLAMFALPALSLAADGRPTPHERRWRLLDAFHEEGPGAIPVLVVALDDEAAFVRRTAAHLLVRLGEPARAEVVKALENPDFQVRRIAIYGLADMGKLLDYWERIKEDDHPSIQREALQTFALEQQFAQAWKIMEDRPVLRFNGESTYVEAPDRVNLGEGNFTYELWFKPAEAEPGTQGLLGSGRGDNPGRRGTNLRYDPAGTIEFRAANRKGDFNLRRRGALVADQWTHLAVTVDRRGKATLYLNGVAADETDASEVGDDDGFDAGPFRVGRRPYTNIWHYSGAIAEVRVWATARSQGEILRNMHEELTGEEEGLLLYWPMNEGEGETVHDKSPNENHGRIVDGEWKR